jgi:UDP-2,4-diacetamido-2,4,6-trideoxy-beta-L-altropyranose hydrolase
VTRTVIIRVDSGDEIGAGHVRRCLSVAAFLRINHLNPVFICRQIVGHISYLIEQAGFEVVLLPPNESLNFSVFSENFSPADFNRMGIDAHESASKFLEQCPTMKTVAWVITDHMLIRKPWQAVFKNKLGCKALAIDGVADYPHDVSILIDPQICENVKQKWFGLISDDCTVFSGPSSLPLSPSFASARKNAWVRNGSISRILVCFGGTEARETVHRSITVLLAWIDNSRASRIEVDIAISSSVNSVKKIRKLVNNDQRFHLHVGLNDLSGMMQKASIAIGSGGIMLWERCLLGLPAIAVPLAENQKKPIERLEGKGAILALRSVGKDYEIELKKALDHLLKNPTVLTAMSENAFKVMADWPATEGWLKIIKGGCNE